MKFAVILGSGTGSRMQYPYAKQFISIAGQPIIIRTLKKILGMACFDVVLIAIHQDWKEDFISMIESFKIDSTQLHVLVGGADRLGSIEESLKYIEKHWEIDSEDSVLIHDAVRPFVSKQIVLSSLDKLKQYDAVVAALPVVDTMLWIESSDVVKSMPDRSKLFCGQAPDTFRLKTLIEAINTLTVEQRARITGTAQICLLRGIKVGTVPGDIMNIKITNPMDLKLAQYFCELEDEQ